MRRQPIREYKVNSTLFSLESQQLLMPEVIQSKFMNKLVDKKLFQLLLEESQEVSIRNKYYLSLSGIQSSNQPSPGCKCSRIDCLKLYCECFSSGRKCNSNCSCAGCKNNQKNQEKILQAKKEANFRHPNYFKGVEAEIPNKICTCKKSFCQKKYCQCFRTGTKCSADCMCNGCKNSKDDRSSYIQTMD